MIGEVFRMSCHYGMEIDFDVLDGTSRYKDLSLGAGSLLDIGIYPLTWALLTLEEKVGEGERPDVSATRQTFRERVERISSTIVQYKESGRQGMISSTTLGRYSKDDLVVVVEGSKGHVEVYGSKPSWPERFTVFERRSGPNEGKEFRFEEVGLGLYFEADDTAVDLADGRQESSVMSWKETIRVMELLDQIRKAGGTVYPQDG